MVVEKDEDTGTFLVMTPDGQVSGAATHDAAEAKARKWFKKHLPKMAIGIGMIEWR